MTASTSDNSERRSRKDCDLGMENIWVRVRWRRNPVSLALHRLTGFDNTQRYTPLPLAC